ncbi:TonB-dependent siderophore receptor [Pleurocapsales cyanobacterium LEGE 06147]|nr:TonB-dependent siderophore receptor [Pleurocapsales cyanobacterium LEGE 06147]
MKLLSVLLFAGVSGLIWVCPVGAEEQRSKGAGEAEEAGGEMLLQLGNATDLVAQGVTRVMGVEVNQTPDGLELILKTVAGSERLVPLILPQGNDLVIDILDATLAFSIRNGVTRLNPAPGITKISVTQVDDSSIRVTITGEKQAPSAEVVPSREDLVLSVTPQTTAQTEADEEIEVIATGEGEEESYFVPDASTATRTDTPIRDIPQSIQVVPQEVIEDQGITRIGDALRNVSGVTPQRDIAGSNFRFTIRGFDNSRILRNGFRSGDVFGITTSTATNSVERIEVLKGPASVLYGQVEPGGVVNFVTKKPLDEPFYNLQLRAGSFGLIEPAIDFTGPLTEDRKLTYRLTASYQNSDSFRDFVDSEFFTITPVISYDFSDNTNLTFEYEYLQDNRTFDTGLPLDPVVFELPRERFLGGPDDFYDTTAHRFYLTLDHRFSENIKLRSGFAAEIIDDDLPGFRLFDVDPESNEISRIYSDTQIFSDNLSWQTDLISEFNTGSVEHRLLAGFELARSSSENPSIRVVGENAEPLAINVFDPEYDPIPSPDEFNSTFDSDDLQSTLGFYLQDQVTLLPNLKLLVGGRYDFARNESEFTSVFEGEPDSGESNFDSEAFSPRVGLVYQPIEPISLYGSFSRSFIPNSVTTIDGEVIEPERGTQYEVGVKGEFGDFSATLAAYDITKTNITRTDPDNPDFSIPIGEVKSRGIELDVAGEPVSGWNIIASLFFNDAFISEGDEFNPEGDTLINAPGSGASLWTTYEIQQGSLQGLGFGAGLFYVGDVEAEIPNDFVIPSYVRVDASLFYRRDNWRAQLNFQNLFNKKYLESTQDTDLLQPGAPFTVVGTVSVEF